LGWSPQHTDIRDIVRTAWEWHDRHPHGFAHVDRPNST
jgi:UDP-glucose 4-epimerase